MGWLPPSCVPYHYFEYNSSPRGRGKRDAAHRHDRRHRLIPTWAGKTTLRVGQQDRPTAHPRMGGENPPDRRGPLASQDSSPHGRGKRPSPRRWDGARRLIPAWAGKTAVADLTEERSEAHPRMGGENSGASGSVPPCVGSSPRGRGKPMEGVSAVGWERLIPTRAGKTSHGPDHRLASTAHPRMGGENQCHLVLALEVAGSSPHGRGKRRT